MSQFAFLDAEWPDLAGEARRAESLAYPDPRTACFYARRVLELAVAWLYKHDPALKLPYQDNLAALIAEPTFQKLVGQSLRTKARIIKDLGNNAVHRHAPVRDSDAVRAVAELFHITYWLAHNYARGPKPPSGLSFKPADLPRSSPVPPQTLKQLQELEQNLADRQEKLTEVLNQKTGLDDELKRLRAEIAEVKRANSAILDTHDYSESETRDYFIDLLLKEAGWPLDQGRDREFPVTGMPTETGEGFVDYVLWGDDGKPLGLVEAKRTKKDARIGQQQAKLYANCLEKQFGQRPVIFYSNGYEHHLWDDQRYPPRPVQGFFTKAELELIIQRRTSLKKLSSLDIKPEIVGRYYQTRAITRVAEHFEQDNLRKALLVMATGAGKTRTVIALADLLMRANWAKRVLFLADRVALVKQAHKAFNAHLPDAGAVSLLSDTVTPGRVMLSTYPTMMKLIDATSEGRRRFGPGYFDLIIIDEAHRSVYQKYKAIFDYFDSYLIGLTATPREEIDRNTYSLFELQDGVPTDAYPLDDAVADEYLVPPRAVSVPLRFIREGIRYNQLSEEEQEEWDAIEWNEDGSVPVEVDPNELNVWLFNENTVDQALRHLMENGEYVAGGDRLGKTIIFAKNRRHAQFIQERFDINYPHLKGSFARVIEHSIPYAQTLIDDFSIADKDPHIAISVDMLDTGIDVPEIVNLVFFKPVRSKTKFWQMLGRGTRLCPNLYGPDQDKQFFRIFDFCQNLEYFSQDVPADRGSTTPSLATRLFRRRVELVVELDTAEANKALGFGERPMTPLDDTANTLQQVRAGLVKGLRDEIAAMPDDNILVRPKRNLIKRYSKPDAWQALDETKTAELSREIAGLPSTIVDPDTAAKLFDELMLRLQLGRLRNSQDFPKLAERVREIAEALSIKAAIPMVADQLAFIDEIQTDEFWQDVTVPQLENVRKRLRSLVKFIDKQAQRPIYTNFEDEIGAPTGINPPIGLGAQSFERFKEKVRHFLRPRENELALQKLRLGLGLTKTDIETLDQMLVAAELGPDDNYEAARKLGLGVFIQSLIGLDRRAAMAAFEGFLQKYELNARQQEFIAMIIEELTRTGIIDRARLFYDPFTGVAPTGVQDLFSDEQTTHIYDVLERIKAQARETANTST